MTISINFQTRRMLSLVRPVSSLLRHLSRCSVSRRLCSPPRAIHGRSQNPHERQQQFICAVKRCMFTLRKSSELDGLRIAPVKVSSNLELRRLQRNQGNEEAVPNKATSLVVIFLPFNRTTADCINSYCNLYHKHGIDVLLVRGHFKDVLSPSSGQKLARQVLDYLTNNETPLNVGKFLLHSVSSGDYLYVLLLNELKEQPVKYRIARQKISGHVFDSMNISAPLSLKLFPINNDIVFNVSEKLFHFYWRTSGNFHEKVMDAFKQDPPKGNILVFYSFGDDGRSSRLIDKMIKIWQNDGVTDIAVSSCVNSDHERLICQHPARYTRAIDTFVTKINLVPHKTVPKNSELISA